uniref:Ig-like domain-containing protein n=1 Tax=Macrostomum lignano TaxID=282301 RepID=A0A1I8GXV1_9PLAT
VKNPLGDAVNDVTALVYSRPTDAQHLLFLINQRLYHLVEPLPEGLDQLCCRISSTCSWPEASRSSGSQLTTSWRKQELSASPSSLSVAACIVELRSGTGAAAGQVLPGPPEPIEAAQRVVQLVVEPQQLAGAVAAAAAAATAAAAAAAAGAANDGAQVADELQHAGLHLLVGAGQFSQQLRTIVLSLLLLSWLLLLLLSWWWLLLLLLLLLLSWLVAAAAAAELVAAAEIPAQPLLFLPSPFGPAEQPGLHHLMSLGQDEAESSDQCCLLPSAEVEPQAVERVRAGANLLLESEVKWSDRRNDAGMPSLWPLLPLLALATPLLPQAAAAGVCNGTLAFCAVRKPDSQYKVMELSSILLPCKVAVADGSSTLPHVFWKVKSTFIDKRVKTAVSHFVLEKRADCSEIGDHRSRTEAGPPHRTTLAIDERLSHGGSDSGRGSSESPGRDGHCAKISRGAASRGEGQKFVPRRYVNEKWPPVWGNDMRLPCSLRARPALPVALAATQENKGIERGGQGDTTPYPPRKLPMGEVARAWRNLHGGLADYFLMSAAPRCPEPAGPRGGGRLDMSLPRFEIIGSTADDFTLQISNVTFDDIGDYECQVIRDGTALQYRTSLSVLSEWPMCSDRRRDGERTGVDMVAALSSSEAELGGGGIAVKVAQPHGIGLRPFLPSQPVINYGVSQLTVSNHNRSLTVLCECSDGYPAPKLTWHLDGKKLTNGVTSSSGSGRSVSSTLTLTPSKAGVVNGSVLECRATNEALTAMKDGPKERKSSVTFVVYEKTGQPVISADAGPVYRAGGRLLLTCQASPGIPLGKLVWHRRRRGEHHAIIISPSSDLRNGQLNNIIALPVSVEDHLAEFTCLAQNAAMEQPLEASTVIRVMFRDEAKVATLVTAIGEDAYKVLRNLCLPETTSMLSARFRFQQRVQKPGESLADFIAGLKAASEHCKFEFTLDGSDGSHCISTLDERLRDQFVFGLRSDVHRAKLLEIEQPDFKTLVARVDALEAAEKSSSEMAHRAEAVAHLRLHKKPAAPKELNKFNKQAPRQPPGAQANAMRSAAASGACASCGGAHSRQQCKLREAKCHNCGKVGHIRKVCRSSKLHKLDPEPSEQQEPLFSIRQSGSSKGLAVELLLQGKPCRFEVDTGSALTVIPKSLQEDVLPGLRLSPTSTVLRTYTGESFRPIGQAEVAVQHNGQDRRLTLLVVEQGDVALLGRDWLTQLRLDWPTILVGDRVLLRDFSSNARAGGGTRWAEGSVVSAGSRNCDVEVGGALHRRHTDQLLTSSLPEADPVTPAAVSDEPHSLPTEQSEGDGGNDAPQDDAATAAADRPSSPARRYPQLPPRSLEMKRAKDASFDHNQVLLSNGEQTSFQCFASAYFDNLMVAWLLDSAEVHRQSVPVGDTLQERNLLSTYSFVFTAAQHGKYLKCQVTNKYGYNLEISMHLFIYYPPESVALTTQDKIMENQTTELTCRAKGGNPLPGISWFFDHQRILENVTQTKNGQEVTSKLRMILTRRDCNKTIFCRANTMNIERGIRSNIIQLDVMFPAELLPIRLSTDRADPGGPKAGDQLEAVCDALGSNPRTIFFWYISHCKQRGGPDGSETCLRLLDDHERVRLTSVADELHWVSQAPRRGFDSRSRVRFRLTPEHHLASLYCETTNAAYYSTARRQVNATLMVRHRPYFQGLASPLTVTAGQKELLPLTVLANPPVQPGSLRVVRQRGDGGTSGSATAAGSGAVSYRDGGLLFNQPSLDDAGPYWIEARNEIGVGRSDFAVEVRAPARIVELEVLEADLRVPPSHYFFRQPLKSSLKIHGRLVASPLPPLSSEAGGSGGWVKWQLPGGGSLACYDPASDAYNFRCWPDASHQVCHESDSAKLREHRLEASNGLGGVASRALFLYPLGPPQVTAQQLRVAVQAGQNASLDCSLTGAPPVDVAWRRLGKDGKFADLAPESRVRQRHWNLTGDLARGVAVLTLTSVATPEDLGVYRCEATSPYGAASADINVTVTSPPEPPSRLRLVNVTTGLEGGRASALLTWRPGHNGGAPQTFIVSCRPADDQRQQFTTYDIVEPDSSGRDMLFRLPDLKPSTNYEITLATRNKLYPETTVTLPSPRMFLKPRNCPSRHRLVDPNSERPSRERKLDAYDEAGSRNLLVAGCGLAVLAVLALNLVCVLYLPQLMSPPAPVYRLCGRKTASRQLPADNCQSTTDSRKTASRQLPAKKTASRQLPADNCQPTTASRQLPAGKLPARKTLDDQQVGNGAGRVKPGQAQPSRLSADQQHFSFAWNGIKDWSRLKCLPLSAGCGPGNSAGAGQIRMEPRSASCQGGERIPKMATGWLAWSRVNRAAGTAGIEGSPARAEPVGEAEQPPAPQHRLPPPALCPPECSRICIPAAQANSF